MADNFLLQLILENKDYDSFTYFISNIFSHDKQSKYSCESCVSLVCKWNNWDVYKTLLDVGLIKIFNCHNNIIYSYHIENIFKFRCYDFFENLIQFGYISKSEIPNYIVDYVIHAGLHIEQVFFQSIIDNYIDITTDIGFISAVFSDSTSDVFDYLIDRGVNINYSYNDYNALYDVCRSGKVDRIEKVIAAGFDISKITHNFVKKSLNMRNDVIKYLNSNINEYSEFFTYEDKLIFAYVENNIDNFINIFDDSDCKLASNMEIFSSIYSNICIRPEFFKFIIDTLCDREFDESIIYDMIRYNINLASYFLTVNKCISPLNYLAYGFFKEDTDMIITHIDNVDSDCISNLIIDIIYDHDEIVDYTIDIILSNPRYHFSNRVYLQIYKHAIYTFNYEILNHLYDNGYNFTDKCIYLNIYKSVDEIINMINYSVEKGYNINTCNSRGDNCIRSFLTSIICNHINGDITTYSCKFLSILKYVVYVGYDIKPDLTYLMNYISVLGQLDYAQYLIDQCDNLDVFYNTHPRHLCKCIKILKLLVNKKFRISDDILAYAVKNKLVPIVEFLLSKGTVVSDEIIYLAKMVGDKKIIDIIDNYTK